MPASDLLERDEQLGLVAATLAAAADGRGGALVVEAAAGLGKTALLEAAAVDAARRGLRVLRARGLELETEHPFGAVRQLLGPVLRDAATEELFAGAAALARPALTGEGGVGDFAALHGMYWLLSDLAARAPLALLVDDAHWLDEPSVRLVSFLMPRVGELPVALVIGSRPGSPVARTGARLTVLDPLSEPAVGRLVQRAMDRDDPALARACSEATAGNPFFLDQILAELRRAPESATPERVRRLAPAGASRAVLARLAGVGPDAAALARAVAVLGDGSSLTVAAKLAELDGNRARAAADALVAADLLAAQPEPAFAHPLVRQAVYEDMPVFRRAEAHRRAARLLAGAGATADAVAAQLLDASPEGDAWTVGTLRAAAAGAIRRGAPTIAADLLTRALNEPPHADEQAGVRLELAGALGRAGRPEAEQHLVAVLQAGGEPGERTQAAAALGRLLALSGRSTEAVDLLERALAEARGGEPERERALLAELLSVAHVRPPMRPRLAEQLEALRTARLSPSTPAGRRLLAMQAIECALAGDPVERVLAAASAALADGRLLAEETADSPTFQNVATVLAHIGESTEGLRLREIAIEDARARGSVFGYALGSTFRGHDRLRAGQLAGAEDDLRAGLELMREHYAPGAEMCAPFLAETLVARGALAEARTALAEFTPPGGGKWPELWLSARGRLRLAEGDATGAADDLVESIRIGRSLGVGYTTFDADAARALLRAGNPELCAELADRELAAARRGGAPRLLGMALHAAGLVRGGQDGIDLLGEGAALLERSTLLLLRAGVLADLGAALRRAGRRSDAREPLSQGLELAVECGAEPLAAFAQVELQALGARPRSILRRGADALTPSERRVAAMARSGMQNREIAQALFVTVKTVETQLSSVYRKLGIASRRELAAALD